MPDLFRFDPFTNNAGTPSAGVETGNPTTRPTLECADFIGFQVNADRSGNAGSASVGIIGVKEFTFFTA